MPRDGLIQTGLKGRNDLNSAAPESGCGTVSGLAIAGGAAIAGAAAAAGFTALAVFASADFA